MMMSGVTKRFNKAAASYDEDAHMQSLVAQRLLEWVCEDSWEPKSFLDIGCGTGLLTQAAAKKWPEAIITALDAAPEMLREARRKTPRARFVEGDAASLFFPPAFDLILSSMMLHWLPDPCAALRNWKKSLRPQGRVAVALLVKGSFQEWASLCAFAGVESGLWPFPDPDFAATLGPVSKKDVLTASFASAHHFLAHIKRLGAATPSLGYEPISSSALRKVLRESPKPFTVTYCVNYAQLFL